MKTFLYLGIIFGVVGATSLFFMVFMFDTIDTMLSLFIFSIIQYALSGVCLYANIKINQEKGNENRI